MSDILTAICPLPATSMNRSCVHCWSRTCSVSLRASAAPLCALLLSSAAILVCMLFRVCSWCSMAALALCSSWLLFCRPRKQIWCTQEDTLDDCSGCRHHHCKKSSFLWAPSSFQRATAHLEVLLCFHMVLLMLSNLLLEGCMVSLETIQLSIPAGSWRAVFAARLANLGHAAGQKGHLSCAGQCATV